MAVRVGINGFGRIGRQTYKAIRERYGDAIDVVAINDIGDKPSMVHLLKYDSNYGRYPGVVEMTDEGFVADGDHVKVLVNRDPAQIPWGDLGVDIVVESTGLFTSAEKAQAHLNGGAKRVIISAPGKGDLLTVVLGVNEGMYDPAKHPIVSNASCTTNGLAPVAKVLNDKFGIDKGILTTVHAYTNTQRLLDLEAKGDLRDARAAALNIVPSSTGAAKAVGLVIPALSGKFTGMAFRVPTSTVSVVDFTAILNKNTSVEEINAVMKEAAAGPLQGIMEYTEELLVSIDLKGSQYSTTFSAPDTLALGGNFIKAVTWYDNEWGYACRVSDLIAYMAARTGANIIPLPKGVANAMKQPA